MARTNTTSAEFRLAGGPPGSSGASYMGFRDLINSPLNTMPLTYTGGAGSFATNASQLLGDWAKSDDPTLRQFGALGTLLDVTRARELESERENREYIRQLRREEAQEAYKMQLPFRIAGTIQNVFKNINEAIAGPRAYELAIRSQTPGLLAQVYANNPYAGRKWLS